MMKILTNMNMTMILTIIYLKTTKIIAPEVDAASWEERGVRSKRNRKCILGRPFPTIYSISWSSLVLGV